MVISNILVGEGNHQPCRIGAGSQAPRVDMLKKPGGLGAAYGGIWTKAVAPTKATLSM
jgi:hypothetical protein